MNYCLFISFDEEKDEFFAMVDQFGKNSKPVFYINDTQEMVDLIKTGVMSHVDDRTGLADFLKKQNILKDDDRITYVKANY
jgi:hypothetical protein